MEGMKRFRRKSKPDGVVTNFVRSSEGFAIKRTCLPIRPVIHSRTQTDLHDNQREDEHHDVETGCTQSC